MPLEVIYVTRHGFRSAWNVDPRTGIYTSTIPTPTGIAADPALTSHGVDQAKELGQHLMTLDPPIEAVYSSPYYRCLQTIAPFVDFKRQLNQKDHQSSDAAASTIRPEYGLGEWFGSAPFDHPVPASPETLKAAFPSFDESYVPVLAPSRKGESIDELYSRLSKTVQAIIAQCDAEGKRAIVLCTHAAAIIALGRVLTGQIPDQPDTEDFHAFTCGLTVHRRESLQTSGAQADKPTSSTADNIGNWECVANGDCSFLSSGPERGWKFAGDESFPGTGSMSQSDADSKL